MDLNQLYSDHQALLIDAARAPTRAVRQLHEVAASHLAGRIGCMQRAMGAGAARGWDELAAHGAGSLASADRHLQGHAS